MKGSLKLRQRRILTRKEALACFTANLALAGSGSLAAGRAVGYAQIAATFLAMILTFVAAIPFFQWVLNGGNASNLNAEDPFQNLRDLLFHMRWVLASIAFYAATVVWSVVTSMSIMADAKKQDVPPIIQ